MNLATTGLLGFGLSMDAFAVSIVISLCVMKRENVQVLRVAGSFGFSQAAMPLLGWLAASGFAESIRPWDHWLAFLLLAGVGVHMVREGFEKSVSCPNWPDPTKGKALFALSVGTSIDAFAAGAGFVGLRVDIIRTVTVIGLMTFGISVVGMLFGDRLGKHSGKRMLVVGGLVLALLGLKILLEHLIA